jgi:hypothetical protein
MGPITGTGRLVFEAEGTLAGSDTIGPTASPAVRVDANLELQGGPLTITGDVLGITDVDVSVTPYRVLRATRAGLEPGVPG